MSKSLNVQNHHRARELAVQFLYAMDSRDGQQLDTSIGAFTAVDGFAAEENSAVKEYFNFLVSGTWNARTEIDNMMRRVVTGWRPERMTAVDRAVLRMAIFEGFIEKKVPVAVAISEAVELASAFGTEDSRKFVNGVLAKILHFTEDNGNAVENPAVTADRR